MEEDSEDNALGSSDKAIKQFDTFLVQLRSRDASTYKCEALTSESLVVSPIIMFQLVYGRGLVSYFARVLMLLDAMGGWSSLALPVIKRR